MTVCPCCGERFVGELSEGCVACGARSVGEPLARPEHELPSYGRAVLVGAMGLFALLMFSISTLVALFERTPFTLGIWPLISAAETASWRLKFIALPLCVLGLWGGWLVYRTIRNETVRFNGQDFARSGLASSVLVILMIATFIGLTVPERLRQRERGIEAGIEAQGYTLHRAQLEYRALKGTLPASLSDLQSLPDPNGTIRAALSNIDPNTYKPSASLADASQAAKSPSLRGAALRKVSATSATDDTRQEGLSFTNYEVRLPGADKIPNTDDDWIMRDGIFIRPAKAGQQETPANASASDTTTSP